MLVLNAEQIRALAPMPGLIECLRDAFSRQIVVPPRQVIKVPGGKGERLFLGMTAFNSEGGGGMAKLATVFPDNQAKGLPTFQAAIVLFSDEGTPTALLDGTIVTQLRTAAASALASSYLSATDSAHLAIIGTGALAPYMALGHSSVRPIHRISICGRHPTRAASTAEAVRSLLSRNINVAVPQSIEATVATADIVCCATSSSTPILAGQWLKRGAFVDLVGSFSPSKRESDDEVIRRSRIFVDTLEGALAEAGDIIDPLTRGIMGRERVEAELADLVTGRVTGRRSRDEITLFKSVGTALEDLAAAKWIVAAAAHERVP